MIIAIGDVHGKFNRFKEQLTRIIEHSPYGHLSLVQVGDFGVGFESPKKDLLTLTEISEILNTHEDAHLYILRGNHDNPAFWDPDTSFAPFQNITFMSDYSVYTIDGYACLFVGGAISIDRSTRKRGVSYWQGEYIQHNPWPVVNCDILFTHDVYHPCSPYTLNSPVLDYWKECDLFLESDLIESQHRMEILHDRVMKTNPTCPWYHGHYHESHVTVNPETGQKTVSLSELEFREVVV